MDAEADHFLSDPVTPRDHFIGLPDAPITLLEYGDYECPDCLNAVPMMGELRRILAQRLRFVFRHFPRSAIHPHASVAAEAAEAAGAQGKFWEMHEALFAHQNELGEIDLSHLALTLGLEIYQFEASLSQKRYRHHIASDYDGGVRSGVKKTPTFFINGRRYDGPNEINAIVTAAQTANSSAG